MNKLSNEMIFYIGLILLGSALIFAALYALVYFIGKKKLNSKFDIEYGKIPEKKR